MHQLVIETFQKGISQTERHPQLASLVHAYALAGETAMNHRSKFVAAKLDCRYAVRFQASHHNVLGELCRVAFSI
jgi:hypothetical protein